MRQEETAQARGANHRTHEPKAKRGRSPGCQYLPVTLSTRRLEAHDKAASLRLGAEAFGEELAPSAGQTPAMEPGPALAASAADVHQPTESWPPSGIVGFGTFENDRLVAKLNGRPYDSWFHGARVPTFGIAGVTVAAEHRGQGMLTSLMARILSEAHDQGAAISTLFPTAPGVYRRFGYELIGGFSTLSVPTSVLQQVQPPVGIHTRRAVESDFDAVRACYDRWGADRNGPLTRQGVMFPADPVEFLAGFTAVTLAVDTEEVVQGFLSWRRGQGYGPNAQIAAEDFIWTSAAARDALLATLASFSAVTGTTRLTSSDQAELDLALPVTATTVVERTPYMLRVLDVPAALGAVRPGHGVTGSTTFSVSGDAVAATNGTYRLEAGGGALICERVAADPRSVMCFHPRGLALAWSGALPLRRVMAEGLAAGGDDTAHHLWDALGLARPVHIRDYF